ncbi:MAG: hypothetical protein NTX53_09720 [candidate division WOR-3 bacterium]|nr:hypothetical protein [candidate division WOR-3 bacterium]
MATPAPDTVKRLVDHFDQNRKAFLSGDYKEEQLRAEFLNPFFTALGWDMDNICEPDNSEFRTQRPECRTSGHSDFWFLTSDFCIIRFVNRKGLSEFSVMPADVLSQVYEQFLGKVIRLTAGHQAKVEEKPEVRKAGELRPAPPVDLATRRGYIDSANAR